MICVYLFRFVDCGHVAKRRQKAEGGGHLQPAFPQQAFELPKGNEGKRHISSIFHRADNSWKKIPLFSFRKKILSPKYAIYSIPAKKPNDRTTLKTVHSAANRIETRHQQIVPASSCPSLAPRSKLWIPRESCEYREADVFLLLTYFHGELQRKNY